ncbi:MAG: hypothetical protein M1831_003118 [Alyxoria varia]|nr:MAG: hypothetical protein M1831_003118 [Alyxoria varia]
MIHRSRRHINRDAKHLINERYKTDSNGITHTQIIFHYLNKSICSENVPVGHLAYDYQDETQSITDTTKDISKTCTKINARGLIRRQYEGKVGILGIQVIFHYPTKSVICGDNPPFPARELEGFTDDQRSGIHDGWSFVGKDKDNVDDSVASTNLVDLMLNSPNHIKAQTREEWGNLMYIEGCSEAAWAKLSIMKHFQDSRVGLPVAYQELLSDAYLDSKKEIACNAQQQLADMMSTLQLGKVSARLKKDCTMERKNRQTRLLPIILGISEALLSPGLANLDDLLNSLSLTATDQAFPDILEYAVHNGAMLRTVNVDRAIDRLYQYSSMAQLAREFKEPIDELGEHMFDKRFPLEAQKSNKSVEDSSAVAKILVERWCGFPKESFMEVFLSHRKRLYRNYLDGKYLLKLESVFSRGIYALMEPRMGQASFQVFPPLDTVGAIATVMARKFPAFLTCCWMLEHTIVRPLLDEGKSGPEVLQSLNLAPSASTPMERLRIDEQ